MIETEHIHKDRFLQVGQSFQLEDWKQVIVAHLST